MRTRMKDCEHADARADATMLITLLFFGSVAYVGLTTDPVYIGVSEGDRAPSLEGMVYNGGAWVDFNLNSSFNDSWVEGSTEGDWWIVQFMDINCGHCKKGAQTISDNAQLINNGPENGRANVKMISVAIALPLQGDDYTRENVVKFRDTYNHEFVYMDDLDNEMKDPWKIKGTPTYFLVKPNGVIAWASPEHNEEDIWDAYSKHIPLVGGE